MVLTPGWDHSRDEAAHRPRPPDRGSRVPSPTATTRGPHSTIRGHGPPPGPTHPYPPRRPLIRPPSGDTGVSRASRPRSGLARTGPLVSDRLSHPAPLRPTY